jgi:sestrin
VNLFLNIDTKKWIKKITCYPETTTKQEFKNSGVDLTAAEKVHVALLAVNSSKQCGLLYGLHAIMKYQYKNE